MTCCRLKVIRFATLYVFLLLLPLSLISEQFHCNPLAGQQKQINAFVQSFYNWYTTSILQIKSLKPAYEIAVNQRPSYISKHLKTGLLEDAAYKTKNPGYLVGLEADPFLDSQDPGGQYKVVSIRYSCPYYIVTVQNAHDKSNTIKVKVIFSGTKLQFVDFIYPEGFTLIDELSKRK